jgi:hypothetical protein
MVNFMLRPLYSQEKSQYPFDRKLGRPHSQFGRFVDGKNLPLLPRFEPRIVKPTAQSLYRLEWGMEL